MKILSVDQIRAADQYTIANEPISSIDLMERAAGKCADWMQENLLLEGKTIRIFCGVGNNGGDGLVLARLLESQCSVSVTVINFSDKSSEDFNTNLKRLDDFNIEVNNIYDHDEIPSSWTEDYLIDAVFGSGLNRKLEGWLKDLTKSLNTSDGLRISIDMPTGLFTDNNIENDFQSVVEADICLSFQNPKMAFVLPESGSFCGEWEIIDIGLDQSFIKNAECKYFTSDRSSLIPLLKGREKFGHKGNYGHALIIAGSKGKMGASVMASRACLKSGVGLLTTFTPECGNEIVQTGVPEAMTKISSGNDFITDIPNVLEEYNAIGIGPGIGIENATAKALKDLFDKINMPVVIDADALNIISENNSLLEQIPENSILTPHPGEFRRLVGDWSNDHERLEKQIEFSKKHNLILVLKGAHTSISLPEGTVYFNTSGNPGMATAGSGDVLLGVITGLLGRGYDPITATKLGVYLHGLAGDLAVVEHTEESLVAGDIINYISDAFNIIY